MKKRHFACTLFFLSGIISIHRLQAHPIAHPRVLIVDSVGIEKKDGKRFILHRVDEGQTLYAIARRYGRSVPEIKAANPDMKDAVRYDQLVRIPIPDGALSRKEEKKVDKAIRKQEKEAKREAKAAEKPVETKIVAKAEKAPEKETKKVEDPARAGIHVVEPGQTLYSLAGRYGVSQSDVRKWNNLSGNNVLIGQALIVSEKAYQSRTPSSPISTPTTKTPEKTTDAPSRPVAVHPTEPRPNEPRSTTPAEPKPERHTDRPIAIGSPANKPSSDESKPAEVEIEPPRPGNDAPMPTRGRRISASGVAEMIEGADGSGKYLALHRSAPIGTLVQVRNEFNNQSLWVKVIGRLPDTGVNDKILIKLSAQAFAKLSPEDRRFRAEVSYIAR